jgi:hypothetical protein
MGDGKRHRIRQLLDPNAGTRRKLHTTIMHCASPRTRKQCRIANMNRHHHSRHSPLLFDSSSTETGNNSRTLTDDVHHVTTRGRLSRPCHRERGMGNGAKIKGPGRQNTLFQRWWAQRKQKGTLDCFEKWPDQHSAANLRQIHSTLTTARPECLVGLFCSIDNMRAGTLGQGTGMLECIVCHSDPLFTGTCPCRY